MLEGTSAWKKPWNLKKLRGAFLPSATSSKLITLRSLSIKRTKVEAFVAERWRALSLAAEKGYYSEQWKSHIELLEAI